MRSAPKIKSFEELVREVARRREDASRTSAPLRVVLCHGVFDLLHIGHVRHLQRAGELGDLLVTTITPDRYVEKGPHRPAFEESLRAEGVASLGCVDLVAINCWPTAIETIRELRPDVYVKGAEYSQAERDITGGIALERRAVEEAGGRIEFTEDLTFSSSNLLNHYTDLFSDDARTFLMGVGSRWSIDRIQGVLGDLRSMSVAVVGEAIIDEYQDCEALGRSSKSPTLAVRALDIERFAGGSLAIANHVSSLCDDVTVVTQLGDSEEDRAFVRSRLDGKVQAILLARDAAPTIRKRRFLDSASKVSLFETYEMDDQPPSAREEGELLEAIARAVARADLVIVPDFGHGLLTPRVVAALSAEGAFLCVTTQSNAGNHGYHRISRYPRADYVCLSEREIRLESDGRSEPLRHVMRSVAARLGTQRLAVTRGRDGALVMSSNSIAECPTLAARSVDPVGAGDAFFAATAPLAACGAPLELMALVGSAAAAQAVATVGHSRSLDAIGLLRQIRALLA